MQMSDVYKELDRPILHATRVFREAHSRIRQNNNCTHAGLLVSSHTLKTCSHEASLASGSTQKTNMSISVLAAALQAFG